MIPFTQSKTHYESWLRKELGSDFVPADLATKNRLMKTSPFVFLRGTYWRWAEIILEVCPDLAHAPSVLTVGDIHLENFGTWRDADGRLVWGVNDFDETARMPYALDLVRLAVSAALAAGARNSDLEALCDPILAGFKDGLADPKPVVLDRDWMWLRIKLVVPENVRQKFWDKIDARKPECAPARFRKVLLSAMPEPDLAFDTARRVAGTGSLGRPRWIGVADWRGAPMVRETKALLTSAWSLAHGKPDEPIHAGKAATGRYRSPDPWYGVSDGIVVRRLSPNNRKIEANNSEIRLHRQKMLSVMGREIANVQLGTDDVRGEIKKDLAARKAGWLAAEAKKAAAAVLADYKQFKKQ